MWLALTGWSSLDLMLAGIGSFAIGWKISWPAIVAGGALGWLGIPEVGDVAVGPGLEVLVQLVN